MTTRTDLLELIANGESSGVKFKCDFLQSHEFAKELVALSNLEGGMVVLGVDDDGRIAGLTRDRLDEWVMAACRDKIRPGIIPYFETIRDVQPGVDVAIVRVLRGFNVQSRWHNNRHTYYIRVGTQSREPTPEELSRLFQQRGTFRADVQPISGTTIDDLDRRRLKDYFERVRQQDVPADDDEAGWRTLLENTEIMVDDAATLSGILLFGIAPNRFLPQAGIDAAAFPGFEKDNAARERRTLRGPLTPLMDRDGTVLEAGLVDQALEFIRRNTPISAGLEDGTRRIKRLAYPEEAVREAVVNAVVHRNYLLANADVELGGLPEPTGNHLTRETPQRHHTGAHTRRDEGRAEPTPEGRNAGLRLPRTHGDGGVEKDRARNERAQRHRSRSRRRRRTVHRSPVCRASA